MSGRILFFITILFIFVFAEIFSFLAFKQIILSSKEKSKLYVIFWWIFTLFLYLFLFFGRKYIPESPFKNYYFNFFMILVCCKFAVALFYFFPTLFSFIQEKLIGVPKETIQGRRAFIAKVAIGLSVIPFSTMLYGMFKTAFDFKLHRIKYSNRKIPKEFNGFKIVQISDIHTGSLHNEDQLQKAIDIVLNLQADMIVFTGDLVNNFSKEAEQYIPILQQLKAPFGVYSILGNHDYGDYHIWKNEKEKATDFQNMIHIHQQLGWKLLRNESVEITKNNSIFTLIGVENWGANLHFKKYGDLKKAYQNIEQDAFQILLSHDPSHWSAEVCQLYPNIDLTLSGHTHGFQFGIEIPGFKWSPSQYIYPHWAGKYQKNEQTIYVNRGLGCLGYMGRVGIKPEITLITLHA